MKVKVWKHEDAKKPDIIEVETAFNKGDKFEMEYDWCTKVECIVGHEKIWHKDIAEFEVVDIFCNMLINPSSVWLRLKSDDKLFQKRCGGCFDVPEEQVLERMDKAKEKERKEAS